MPKSQPPERQSCFKLTDDNWYPSFMLEGYYNGIKCAKLVEVMFLQFLDNSGYRCCVWGADDCGMDFDTKTRKEAWEMYLKVIGLPKVNQGWLKNQGFIPA